LICTNIF